MSSKTKAILATININSILTSTVGALVWLGITKADKAFVAIERIQVEQDSIIREQVAISHRVDRIESALGFITVPNHKP